MLKASFVLSALALAMSVIAYSTTHWGFPPVGFEGAIVFGGMLLWLSAICALLTWGFCLTLFVKRRRAQLSWPLSLSALAVVILSRC
jgi:hypothetical protein